MTWNDQVASRRRGIGGRFMSISKRWAGFGSTKASNSQGGNANNSNFNAQLGFYPPESPEAIMRQLADYAVILRDYKLAQSTYETVRSDFAHDKAWIYHAGANEMAALSSLLLSPHQSKGRLDLLDQWLDTAVYSYLTRSSYPAGAMRCLTLATELLFDGGNAAVDHAASWAGRLLELSILSPLAQVLTAERMADFYSSKVTAADQQIRRRQASFWNVTAALSWLRVNRPAQARWRTVQAGDLYGTTALRASKLPFLSMHSLWNHLTDQLVGNDYTDSGSLDNGSPAEESFSNQEEHLDSFVSRPNPSQASLIAANNNEIEGPHIAGHQRHGSTMSAYENDGFE